MSEKNKRPPAQIVKSISEKGSEVRNAAAALTERIRQFENYLAMLPGRVDAQCYGAHPHDEPGMGLSLTLRLHRNGKGWAISWGSYREGYNDVSENPIEWKPLVDAPLAIKMAAVNIFPDLLLAIELSQGLLVDCLNGASRMYDKFARTLELPPISTARAVAKILDGNPVQDVIEEMASQSSGNSLLTRFGVKEAK